MEILGGGSSDLSGVDCSRAKGRELSAVSGRIFEEQGVWEVSEDRFSTAEDIVTGRRELSQFWASIVAEWGNWENWGGWF